MLWEQKPEYVIAGCKNMRFEKLDNFNMWRIPLEACAGAFVSVTSQVGGEFRIYSKWTEDGGNGTLGVSQTVSFRREKKKTTY